MTFKYSLGHVPYSDLGTYIHVPVGLGTWNYIYIFI